MNSSRLPGKVIKKFGNYKSIEILIKRIKKSNFVNEIILATTTKKLDDVLVKVAKENNINFYRGSETDVLGRLSNAVKYKNQKHIIQLTGDNPFIDPEIIDCMCRKYLKLKVDFLTNNGFMKLRENDFPLGMHVSIFKTKDIIKISNKTKNLEDRTHPTLYFYRTGKSEFKLKNMKILKKWKKKFKPRLTLDTKEDYLFLKKIFKFFNNNKKNIYFSLQMIMNYLDKNKKLMSINKKIKHKIPTNI